MDKIRELLPFLIPIILLQLALMIFALVDLIRRERTKGPKWLWALIVVFVNFVGPILYFMMGRED
jgi:hypothetical protein